MVAYLTARLKDRRHVLCERDLRLGRLPARRNCREQRDNDDGYRDDSHAYLRERSSSFWSVFLCFYTERSFYMQILSLPVLQNKLRQLSDRPSSIPLSLHRAHLHND